VLSDEVRVALGTLPGVIVMINRVTYGTRKGAQNVELFGLGKGTPDLIVIVCGVLLGLELKTPVGRQSEDQKRVEAAWTEAGAYYRLARSVEDARARVAEVVTLDPWASRHREALLAALERE
jgi:hypothetical protein